MSLVVGEEVSVTLGEGCVVIRRSLRSASVVAQILGVDGDLAAPKRIYLDRLVHRPDETELGEYGVSGAISSILEVRP